MTTIGDLTLNDIGKTRIRTEYENATIEGRITNLNLDIETHHLVAFGGLKHDPLRDQTTVTVNLTLGRIELHDLDRNHPCEVIA